MSRSPRFLRARAFMTGSLLALAACGGDDEAGGLVSTATAATQQVRAAVNARALEQRRTAMVDATKRVSGAVVSISVTSRRRVQPSSPFELFFIPEQAERLVTGYGTGFVIRADGMIVTNQHVVAGAEKVMVTLADGSDVPAEVLGDDPTTDIAVLKVKKGGLSVAPIGRSTDLMIGEWVVAMGNPFAFLLGNAEPTVTVGVVSATGRNILPSGEQPGLYLDMIQTDAAINPGNSGGPLANALGEVVGVNSSIFSNSGGSVGLGFAIPIERVMRVTAEIIAKGSVRRAWTGLEVEGAQAMSEWKSQGGVTVTNVAPGSPSAKAGIKRGDVLVEANGRRLRNFLDWEAVKVDLHVGDPVEVKVRAGTGTQTRRIVTGDLPSVTAERVTVLKSLQLITVDQAVRAERNLRSTQGALIVRLESSVAQATGLQVGDVIVAVNNLRVGTAEQAADLMGGIRPKQPFRLYLEREGQILFVDLTF